MRSRSHGEIVLAPAGKLNDPPSVGFMFDSLAADPHSRLPETPEAVSALAALGEAMTADPGPAVDSAIPAAYTYFGQFIDHDITKTAIDPSLVIPPATDPIADPAHLKPVPAGKIPLLIHNLRTLRFDLDSVYDGPLVASTLQPDGSMRLSEVSGTSNIPAADRFHDLPRKPKINNPITDEEKQADREALIGDPRNDENLVVAQLHVAFIRAHNVLVRERGQTLAVAKSSLRRRYQWAVLHDFLPTIGDKATVADVLANGPRFLKPADSSEMRMPLEFSAAAYRFGHSLVRADYDYNGIFLKGTPFSLLFMFTALSGGLGGSDTLPHNWIIDWAKFFGNKSTPASVNPARLVDTHLVPPLAQLPDFQGRPLPSLMAQLATRNLLRGYLLGLPCGQAVARHLNLPVLDSTSILQTVPPALHAQVTSAGLDTRTPLWFYVLAESASPNAGAGQHLGPLGTRIVAETFWNAVKFSEDSVLQCPPSPEELATNEFSLKGIVRMGLDKGLPALLD